MLRGEDGAVTLPAPATFFRGVASHAYPELPRELEEVDGVTRVTFEVGGRIATASGAGARYELEVVDAATYDQLHWASLEAPTVAALAAAWDAMMTALLR